MKCRAVGNPWQGLPAGDMCACLWLHFVLPDPGVGAELCKAQCNIITFEVRKLRYEVCQLRHTFSSDSVEDLTGTQ